MLLWNIERGISPNTCSHSLQAITFLGFLPDDVNSAAIGDLIVPQVLAWLQNPPSIDQVCSREEETRIPSVCLTERKKHRYHQGALIPQFICRVLVCCRVKNAGVGRARYLHLMTWQRWLCNTLETLPVTCTFSNSYKYSIWLVQQPPPPGYSVSSLFWDSHCPHTVCLWQDTEKATLGRFWTSRIRLSSKT